MLGAPASKLKSKTNVGKFAVLGIVLAAFLFIVAGLLIYQRHKRNQAAAEPVTASKRIAQAIKPGFAQKNAAVESDSIEKTKAEIKKKENDEKAQLKAIQDAQAEAQRQAEAEAAKKGATGARRGSSPSGSATANGQQAAPRPPTPAERAMAGGVLLETTGARPKADGPLSDKDQQQREVQARLSAMGAQPAGGPGAASGGGSAGQGSDTIAARLQPTVLQARSAGRLPDLDYLLKKGTSIPCALKTGIDTTLPGFVICEVLNDVRSANGNTVLIDRGATVFGEQQSSLKQGQARTFVLWTRIDNPSGIFVNIDSPASDQMGYSGVPGYVDTHFWQRFGGAIMLSLIQDFSAAMAQRWANQQSASNNTGATVVNSQPPLQNTQQAAQNMASEALRNSINIPPTLVVNPATIVNVMVARDVSFENVFSLVK
ncbi:type IV secretion system protein VirB10 [Caenimonas koreensis]|uniref:type IV secretion system protein VirB10 n=1 Tax=Caenimonas koreensis TaxID=367474 RepID=UPI002B27239A|nr:type IV secretion system protein VirB10 [Caenimonas koreensis]